MKTVFQALLGIVLFLVGLMFLFTIWFEGVKFTDKDSAANGLYFTVALMIAGAACLLTLGDAEKDKLKADLDAMDRKNDSAVKMLRLCEEAASFTKVAEVAQSDARWSRAYYSIMRLREMLPPDYHENPVEFVRWMTNHVGNADLTSDEACILAAKVLESANGDDEEDDDEEAAS